MMTIEMFASIIVSFCSFKDPSLIHEYKVLCMEHMYNCAIHGTSDGSSVQENQVEYCKQAWIKKNERR